MLSTQYPPTPTGLAGNNGDAEPQTSLALRRSQSRADFGWRWTSFHHAITVGQGLGHGSARGAYSTTGYRR